VQAGMPFVRITHSRERLAPSTIAAPQACPCNRNCGRCFA
jgi:hypothetical protein